MMKQRHRYLLLCRHARHDDGALVAVKGEDDVWRFPTESVARALVEEVVFGADGLCLAKVLYAPTREARRTAALLLRRMGGMQADAKRASRGVTAADGKLPQPALPTRPVVVKPPSWLPMEDATCDGTVEHAQLPELLPSRLDDLGRAVCELETSIEKLQDGHALLIVGHQPQLGWLGAHFTRRRLGWVRRAVPIDSSEVVCLRLRERGWSSEGWFEKKWFRKKWRGQLVWTLAPNDREALEDVASKVKGKMESAKLLSAVITLVLTALLGVLLDANRWNGLADTSEHPTRASLPGWSYSGQTAARIAFVMLLAALALYLLTMYSYDRLLMPPRFWAEGRNERRSLVEGRLERPPRPSVLRRWLWRRRDAWLPRRPPSSAAWVVYRNMQRIWYCLFTPANVLVALALLVLASALLRLQGTAWILMAAFFVIVAGWWWWFRPVLGSED